MDEVFYLNKRKTAKKIQQFYQNCCMMIRGKHEKIYQIYMYYYIIVSSQSQYISKKNGGIL